MAAATKELKEIACKHIDNCKDTLKNLSTQIWNNPELALMEFKAHDLLSDFLSRNGFTVKKSSPLKTAFIAKYGNKTNGVTVGICCEYDALAGIGHGCGHNLIAESSIGAALGVQAAMKQCTDFDGKVIVYGTPAEEAHGGKVKMIDAGVFDECDICMMAHPAQYDLPDPILMALSQLTVVFTGKTSHAAMVPWEGFNALDAAMQCYNSVSMLRQQMKPTSRIHGIIKKGENPPNIIPEKSELDFYVRAVVDKDMFHLKEQVLDCAKGAALSTGCTVDISETSVYRALNSNRTLVDLFVKNAEKEGVIFNYNGSKQGGSTDMGNVSAIKPSIHPKFKINSPANIHTAAFCEAAILDENQFPTLRVAKCLAMTAIDVLSNTTLMVEINNDFSE